MLPSSDIWADRPAASVPKTPTEPAPPWYWDVDSYTGNAALRRRDGHFLLAVVRCGESWGIFQLQILNWELVQVRSDRESAIAEALAGARRVGLI